MDGLTKLVEKFPDGYEGYVEEPELEVDEEMKDEVPINIDVEAEKLDKAEKENSHPDAAQKEEEAKDQKRERQNDSHGIVENDPERERGTETEGVLKKAQKETKDEGKSKEGKGENAKVPSREETRVTENGHEQSAKEDHPGENEVSDKSEENGKQERSPLKTDLNAHAKHVPEIPIDTKRSSTQGQGDSGSQAGSLKRVWLRTKGMWAKDHV